jgi:hypothetical protein
VPKNAQIVDAVRPDDHAAHDRQGLRVGCRTGTVPRAGELHLLGYQPGQAAPLGQPDRGDEPGMRDQVRVVEGGEQGRRAVGITYPISPSKDRLSRGGSGLTPARPPTTTAARIPDPSSGRMVEGVPHAGLKQMGNNF